MRFDNRNADHQCDDRDGYVRGRFKPFTNAVVHTHTAPSQIPPYYVRSGMSEHVRGVRPIPNHSRIGLPRSRSSGTSTMKCSSVGRTKLRENVVAHPLNDHGGNRRDRCFSTVEGIVVLGRTVLLAPGPVLLVLKRGLEETFGISSTA